MVAQAIQFASSIFGLSWLRSPILGKELRVVSRKRRHYLLRVVYLALLSLFALIAWINAVEFGQSSAMSIYQMADAGKWIVGTICWFQFITIPFIAVILMSTSISDEVYHGTLGILMTTPINSLQIVLGKLLSKMLHLVSLLAISLPLLAVIRIFGGVPWSYVIASWCITLTAALFAGAVTIFFSALFRRAYAIILLTLAGAFVFYAILPWMLAMALGLLALISGMEYLMAVLLYINPFSAMSFCTMELAQPGMSGATSFSFYWPIHCLVMLGCSAAVLVPCVALVRRASLRQVLGGKSSPKARSKVVAVPVGVLVQLQFPGTATLSAVQPVVPAVPVMPEPMGQVRRISGSPLVWKKLRMPMLPNRALRIVGICIALLLAIASYALVGANESLHVPEVQAVFVVVFVLIGITATAVLAAVSISSEKESRSLPILLTTPLADWHIIGASLLEVIRRSLPVWIFLFAHLAIFTLVGFLHPIVLLHGAMLVIWLLVFLGGTGLYLSSRFKRTTPAVVINLGLALGIWAILPWMLALMGGFTSSALSRVIIDGNPVFQAWNITSGAGDYGMFMQPDLEYYWFLPETQRNFIGIATVGPGLTTLIMFGFMFVCSMLGFVFLWRAKARLRRDIF